MNSLLTAFLLSMSAQSASAPLLDAALGALGGRERAIAGASFEAEQRGHIVSNHQSRDPRSYRANAPRSVAWRVDAASGQTMRESHLVYPGGIDFYFRLGFDPRGGWNVDLGGWRAGTDRIDIDAAAAAIERRAMERQFPHLLLLRAAAAPDLAVIENSLTFAFAGAPLTIEIDPTSGRPIASWLLRPDGRREEVRYSEWRIEEGGLAIPARTETRVAGEVSEELRLTAFRRGAPDAAAFRVPDGYAPPPTASGPNARRLAPNLYLLEGLPGSYRSIALIEGRDVSLIEAPIGDAHAAAQQALIEGIAPGARVRRVILTHHHSDHVGGAGWFAERGASLIVPAGAAAAIRAQIVRQRPALAVEIEEVAARRRLAPGTDSAELLPVSSQHAALHLVAYLPAARALYQGDMYYLPDRGGPPVAFSVSEALSALLAAESLDVQTIIGTHGRPADMLTFRESLRLRRARAEASRPD